MRINLREPRIQKVILATIAIAGAGYYYFMSDGLSFSYRARSRVIAEKRDDRDKLEAEVKKARASATRLAELRKESDELAASWHRVEARLPAAIDQRELMSQITGLGSGENLQFLLLEPQATKTLDFCVEVPFSVRVLGYYNQLGRFFADLDNAPRILRLDGLRVVGNPKAKDDKEQPPLIAEFEVSTFVLGGGTPPGEGLTTPGETGGRAVGASAKPPAGGHATAVPASAGPHPGAASSDRTRAPHGTGGAS